MDMARRWFFTGLPIAILSAPLAALAQQAGKIYRIGWLALGSPAPEVTRLHDRFRRGLQEYGYVDGRNYVIEFRWAHGHAEQLAELAADLARMRVDVIVAVTSHGAHAAKRATATIPILLITPDPLSTGLVTNLSRPGGNVTGVTMFAGPEIVGKYVELIKAAVPALSRLGVLWSRPSPWQQRMVHEAEAYGRTLRIHVQPAAFDGADDFDAAFAEMAPGGAESVLILPDGTTFAHRKRLAALALRHRLPALFTHLAAAADGGLMAFATNVEDLFHRAASYVDRLKKGAKAGDLPIEQPTKFYLAINLKTARALGLTIPPSLLLRADQVLE